jgi:hypothetical protein
MEILKRGIKPEEREYVATCNICESVIKLKENDLTYVDERCIIYQYVKCPVCNSTLYINKNNIIT